MRDPLQMAPLLFAQTAAALVRSELRWEFLNVAAAIALLCIALAAIALFFFRRKTRDLTLLYFGLFCSLYAIRLLTDMRFFRSLFDEPRAFWTYLNWVITCTILIPFGLFFYQLGGDYLRKRLRWLLAVQMLFAVFGISAAALGVKLAYLSIANSILVLVTCVLTVVFLLADRWRAEPHGRTNHEMLVFIVGLFVWFLFIAQANLFGPETCIWE